LITRHTRLDKRKHRHR